MASAQKQAMNDVTLQDVFYHHNGGTSSKCGVQTKTLRPRTSCNQCRFRKIRCDRIKPCSACCSRGKPTDCLFPVDASNRAIDQARQLRLLRKENAELRDLLEKKASRDARLHLAESTKNIKKVHATISRRLRAEEPGHSLVYGSLSGPEIKEKLDQLQNQPRRCRPASLAHPRPRRVDVLTYQNAPADPFPSLWEASSGPKSLLHIFPPHEEVLELLRIFNGQGRCFQYLPNKLVTPEVSYFLADLQNRAERSPQMLALVFAGMAHALQFRLFQKKARQSKAEATEKELIQADIYLAASMHALRLSSFMNRPTLLAVQTLLLMGAYLVNSGKFLDAYTLYGQTIRVAQGMGLHQDPQYLDPVPGEGECDLRRNTWWLMIYVDQYYSVTLGRPLGIAGIGDCLPSSHLTFSELADSQKAGRLETYINQYTILSRQIISCDNLTNTKIDEFTDRLLQLQDTLPALVRFNESWLDENCDAVPEWPLNFHATMFHSNIHNYLVLLNRQRQFSTVEKKLKKGDVHGPERGYATVISSCHEVLRAFFYCHRRLHRSLVHWTLGQQAFNAAMLLSLNVLENGPRDIADSRAVVSAYNIFLEMQERGVCRPAKLAAARLKELLDHMAHNHAASEETVMAYRGMILVEDPEIRGAIGKTYTPFGLPMEEVEVAPCTSPGDRPGIADFMTVDHARTGLSDRKDGNQYDNSATGNDDPIIKSERSSGDNSPLWSASSKATSPPGEDDWDETSRSKMRVYPVYSTLPAQVAQQCHSHHQAASTMYRQGNIVWVSSLQPVVGQEISSSYTYTSVL